MLANIREIFRPASVAEAVARLASGQGRFRAMAGGTARSLFKGRNVEGIVDLWSLPLRFVRSRGGQLSLGATATLGDLVQAPEVRRFAGGGLWEAARRAGSTPLRNLITVGGNLAGLYPWSNLPPALLVLDARVRIAGPAGPELGIDELLAQHPSRALGPQSLITEVVVPACPPGGASAFVKHAESAFAYTWLDVAAWVHMDGGHCRACRLAVGGIEPRCRRLLEVEELVAGSTLDERTAAEAGEHAAVAVSPLPDPRAGAEYRRELVRVLTRRTLLEAARRAAACAAGGEV